MKTVLKVFLVLIGILVLAVGGMAAYISFSGIPTYDPPPKIDLNVEPVPSRVEQGRRIANMVCVACHLDPKTNRLTGKKMLDMPKEFGVAYSANITQHPEKGIGKWTDGELYTLFRTGLKPDGSYTPPWMVKFPLMADEDVYSIIAFLRSDAPILTATETTPPPSEPSFLMKFLSRVAFKPLPMPSAPIALPDTNNPVAVGKYLALGVFDCYGCHSINFEKTNPLDPEKSGGFFGGGNPMLNMEGELITSPNITPDKETGIGNWSEADFIQAVKYGKKPDGKAIRYPMVPYAELSRKELSAIFAYLKTVPPLNHKVDRPE
jgi:mono/diheme cytochrome c family protein